MMVEPLIASGGAGAKAGHQLKVVLAGVEQEGGLREEGMMALEDLHHGPGGRHSNDHSNFR